MFERSDIILRRKKYCRISLIRIEIDLGNLCCYTCTHQSPDVIDVLVGCHQETREEYHHLQIQYLGAGFQYRWQQRCLFLII